MMIEAPISEYILEVPISLRTHPKRRTIDYDLIGSRMLLFWVALKRAEYKSFVKDGRWVVVKRQVVHDDLPVLVFAVITFDE